MKLTHFANAALGPTVYGAPGPSLRRQHHDCLDFEQGAWPRELRHANRRTRWRGGRVDELVAHLAIMRDIGADIDDVEVELDDIGESRANGIQSCLYVLKSNLHLLTRVRSH